MKGLQVMNVYKEENGELITDPDLEAGYVYPGQRVKVHHEAVAPVTRIGVLPGTEHCNGGAGLRGTIVVTPGTPAWDEYEECQYYHKYTEAELAARHPPDETDDADLAARVDKLETGKENQTDVDELQEALELLLSGVTE